MMGGKHKGSKQIKFEQVGIYYTLGGGMALATPLLPEGKKYLFISYFLILIFYFNPLFLVFILIGSPRIM